MGVALMVLELIGGVFGIVVAGTAFGLFILCSNENAEPHGWRQPNGKPLTLWYFYGCWLRWLVNRANWASFIRALAVVLGLRS